MEDWYMVMIEKIYNLTLATRLSEALVLTKAMAEKCAVQGSSRVRAWLECYLTVIYFYQGDYIKCLQYYEKSLSLPEEEQDWLSRHCMGAYAAKTYQLTGQEERSIPLMESEISRLRRLGLYDELSLNYLIYAEILLTEEIRKLSQGVCRFFSFSKVSGDGGGTCCLKPQYRRLFTLCKNTALDFRGFNPAQ